MRVKNETGPSVWKIKRPSVYMPYPLQRLYGTLFAIMVKKGKFRNKVRFFVKVTT